MNYYYFIIKINGSVTINTLDFIQMTVISLQMKKRSQELVFLFQNGYNFVINYVT